MYNRHMDLEEKCFTANHMELVFIEMKQQFPHYFRKFIETCAGIFPSASEIDSIQKSIGLLPAKSTGVDVKKNLLAIIQSSITDFEKDRESYLDFFKMDYLEEFEYDPNSFKKKFATDCGIVRVTLHSKEKSLDAYRRNFKLSKSDDLLEVAMNITAFALEHPENWKEYAYDCPYTIEELADNLLELGMFDEEGYGVFGVIGGGIKSYIAHKLTPEFFPHRSKEAVWALWYLVNQKTFGCTEDSEFLMIDTEAAVTNQNFYYPYGQFGNYCYLIYTLLRDEMEKFSATIPASYRYVIVNRFLYFVAGQHEEEIKTLSRNIREVVFE